MSYVKKKERKKDKSNKYQAQSETNDKVKIPVLKIEQNSFEDNNKITEQNTMEEE